MAANFISASGGDSAGGSAYHQTAFFSNDALTSTSARRHHRGNGNFSSGSSALMSNDVDVGGTGVPWEYFDERSYVDQGGLRPGEDAYKRNKFNQEASDRLASNRDVPDTRSGACRRREWRTDLPPTTVIITFHNEARSTLLRTIVR